MKLIVLKLILFKQLKSSIMLYALGDVSMALKENEKSRVNWKVNLVVLWIGVFFACASYTMVVPFLPVYLLHDLNVGEDQVNFWSGLVYSVTFLGAAFMAPYWGARADKVGQRKMAIRAGFGLALTYFFTGICQNVMQLFVVRAVTGIISGFVPASMSLISSTLPERKMGWGMGLMQTAVASGSILGPLLGGYLSSWFGMRTSFFVGSGCLFLATFLVIFFVHDVAISAERQKAEIHLWQDLKEALKNKNLLYIMNMFFVIQVCIMIIQPLITMYVADLMGVMNDDTVKTAGVIFSLAGIAGIIAAPFWGKRGQRFGYVKIFCLVVFGAGFVNLFQVFVHDVWQFACIQFIYGLFLAGAIPNINANLVEVTDQSVRGKAFGLVTSAQQFGGVVGPLLGGALGHFLPTRFILVFTGCILISTSLYSYINKVRKKTV